MWQRFTEHARQVVYFAQEEATVRGDKFVSTEHLLLGLIHVRDSAAVRILARIDVSAELVDAELKSLMTSSGKRTEGDMQLSPLAKRVVDLATEESRLHKDDYIGTEHMLIALIREDQGLAGKILIKNGASLEAARVAIADRDNANLRDTSPKPGGSTTTARAAAKGARAAATQDVSVGDLGLVRTAPGRDTTELARTTEAFLQLTDVFLAKDAQGYRELLSSAEGYATPLVVLIYAGTTVKLLVTPRDTDSQAARLGCYVRILSGDFAGQTGFLRRESFARTGSDDAPFPPPVDDAAWITTSS